MAAKEKAIELVDKFIRLVGSNCEHDSYCDRKECNINGDIICHVDRKTAKQCALMAVQEVLNHKHPDAEGLYITLEENLKRYNDLGTHQNNAVQVFPEGFSADKEVFYSIK